MTDPTDAPYRDPTCSTETRVTDLLERMTLEEKVGQLVGTWAGELRESKGTDTVSQEVLEYGIGSVASFGWAGAQDMQVEAIVETVNELQRVARSETRLGIPVLFAVDAVHGHAYVAEGTAFPNGLGLAATWDDSLAESVAAVTATEVRATGAHQNYSPTCDVARDPRWGRTFETFGESPYLCGRFAAAKIRGYQGGGDDFDTGESANTVIATAKHFPAYGEPVRGEDTAPVEVSEYLLTSVFLPPFVDAIEAGVNSVMPCYNAVNGEPAHGSRQYLHDLLREDLEFSGTVVADWNGVRMLHEDHRVAVDHRESVRQTRAAGLDIASVDATAHVDHLRSLVEEGDLPEAVVNESVRRVLRQKFELGLFEDPFVDGKRAARVVGSSEHRELSLAAACDSMTLLSNDGTLPLSKGANVLLTGPNADAPVAQLGGWSVPSSDGTDIVTIKDGLEAVSEGTVSYERGTGINTVEPDEREAAVRAAKTADVAVVALGENWYIHEFGPSELSGTERGDFPTRHRLELPEAQQDLLTAIAETGTPIVGVLVTGRPLAVPWLAEHAAGLLLAYYPGTMGGQAVAETIYGDNEPSGRLPISIPRSAAHLPTRFNHFPHPTPIGAAEHPSSYDPLFGFGAGESYTTFDFGTLEVPETPIGPTETAAVSVPVENTGDRRGTTVVQLYLTDEPGSTVTPVRQLRGFKRVTLEPGESTTVSISIAVDSLSRTRRRGEPAVSGAYTVEVEGQTAVLTVAESDN